MAPQPVGQKPAEPMCYPGKKYMFDANGNVPPLKPGQIPACKAEPQSPNQQSTQHKNDKHTSLYDSTLRLLGIA